MTPEEIRDHKVKIDGMSQLEMARLQRFAPTGHPYFDTHLLLWQYFEESFKNKGGMTPAISKELRW